MKPCYYDDEDVVQKLSPGNFCSYSYFIEDIVVEKIKVNDSINKTQVQKDNDKNQLHYKERNWLGFFSLILKGHDSNQTLLAHVMDLRSMLTKEKNE